LEDETMERDTRKDTPGGGFAFRKLDVYRCMCEYIALEHDAVRRFPVGHADLRDQLDRAGNSMLLNFGEGAGKKRDSRDRKRYWGISRGSTCESACAWDACRIRNLSRQTVCDDALSLLDRISAMLSAMMR
jgi:four helix bundle protein